MSAAPALLAAAALAVTLQPPAAGPHAASRPAPCIQIGNGVDTEYTPVDDHTIVVRSFSRWWKLTTTPSSLLDMPTAFLVSEIRGTSQLCSPIDFQLSVVERPGGGREGLIVQSFEPITPEEGKALRRAARR